jgi:hypothetical protein
MSKVVKTGDIAVSYAIFEYETHAHVKYDWMANGDESAEWFDTLEEAEEDVKRRFG